METKSPEAIRTPLVQTGMRILLALGLFCFAISNAQADAVSEMAGFSVFDKVDLAELAKTDGKVAHGAPMSGHYISAQSCFVVAAPPARVADGMRQWNPARHSELKVLLHSDLPSSPAPANFSRLSSAPNNSAVRSLVTATQSLSPDLQISREEAKKFAAVAGATGGGAIPAPVAAAWADVLSARARAFSSGGSAAQPPYDHTSEAVRPAAEFNGLLSEQARIRRQFSGLIDSSGIGRGGASLKPELYWELLTADEQGVLTLGASYRRPGANGTFQAADALYYASGGYYVGLTLYQMWPVDIGGRPSTLVWRGDMVSAASIASLHGIERVASESAMMRDISKAVAFFRRDIGGGR